MSVLVVKEDGFYKDNPVWGGDKYLKYVKSDGTVSVPDMSDLNTKASNTDLENLKNEIKDDIKDSNEFIQTKINSLTSDIMNKFDNLKNVILSNERLEQEIQSLRDVENDIIEHISNEYSVKLETIRKEIKTFQQMDLGKDLLSLISPVKDSIKIIDRKSDDILSRIGTMEELDRKITDYKSAVSEMKHIYDKFRSERNTIMKKIESKYNKKINMMIVTYFVSIIFILIILYM